MFWMLVVETIAKIRRLSLVQGKSIKAICRELKISRKVVRKVLRSGETEFRYERKHQPYPRMGAWREELDRVLSANAGKPTRERLAQRASVDLHLGRLDDGRPLGQFVADQVAELLAAAEDRLDAQPAKLLAQRRRGHRLAVLFVESHSPAVTYNLINGNVR